MKQNLKNASPAFAAILIVLIVGSINILGYVPSNQQNNFENMSNIMLLATALAGFLLAIPSVKSGGRDLFIFLGNILVSVMAFPMNIIVFGHTIQLDCFWESLWGWHIGWVICAMIQIYVLSGRGERFGESDSEVR